MTMDRARAEAYPLRRREDVPRERRGDQKINYLVVKFEHRMV